MHSLSLPREKEEHLLNALEPFHHRHVVERPLFVHPVGNLEELGHRTVVKVRESQRAESKVVSLSFHDVGFVSELQPVNVSKAARWGFVVDEVQDVVLMLYPALGICIAANVRNTASMVTL